MEEPAAIPTSDRALPAEVCAWIERLGSLEPEVIPVNAAARGRWLAHDVLAGEPFPPAARAAENGYALRAEDTVGASAYGPLVLRWAAGSTIGRGEAMSVTSGAALPEGADAVLPLEDAESGGGGLHVCAAVAAGAQVIPAALEVDRGDVIAACGALRPQDLARLRLLAVERVSVVRRPRVRLVAAAAPTAAPDAAGLMLDALVQRDGGLPERRLAATPEELQAALQSPGADLILVHGGSGDGPNDHAASALARVGTPVFSGMAIHPGESTAAGRVDGVPVMLLPGTPVACLCAYEMIAGGAVRHLGGGGTGWPYGMRRAILRRKIASRLGRLEFCRVRCDGVTAVPLGIAAAGALRTAVEADGFVLVDVDSEGYAPDTEVSVHVFP